MPRDFWTPIDPSARVRDLAPISVLILVRDRSIGVVAEFRENIEGGHLDRYKMNYQPTSPHARAATRSLPIDVRIGDAAETVMENQSVVIVALPPESPKSSQPRRWRTAAALSSAMALGASMLLIAGELGAWLAFPVALIVFALVWNGATQRKPKQFLAPGDLQLDYTNVVEYAQGRLAGERPELRSLEQRRSSIHERVEAIKEDFGRLSTDIIYRIENAALFDTSDPVTERFQAALIQWDTNTSDGIDVLEGLAGEVEVSFAVAQDHAETIGLNHLPANARDAARRAGNAARLAKRASTDGERVASMRQVARILDSLALYYLPTISPETLAIEAPAAEQ